jgi:hypothetical protein
VNRNGDPSSLWSWLHAIQPPGQLAPPQATPPDPGRSPSDGLRVPPSEQVLQGEVLRAPGTDAARRGVDPQPVRHHGAAAYQETARLGEGAEEGGAGRLDTYA